MFFRLLIISLTFSLTASAFQSRRAQSVLRQSHSVQQRLSTTRLVRPKRRSGSLPNRRLGRFTRETLQNRESIRTRRRIIRPQARQIRRPARRAATRGRSQAARTVSRANRSFVVEALKRQAKIFSPSQRAVRKAQSELRKVSLRRFRPRLID